MNNREIKGIHTYPWKGFLIFLGIYLLSLAMHYPALVAQAEVYINILGDSFNYTSTQFALMTFIQPLLLGIVALYFGHRYAHQVQLRSLINESVEKNDLTATNKKYSFKDSVPFLISAAVVIALLELGFDFVFQNWLPEIFQPQYAIPTVPQTLSSLFFSGLVQEMLLRWGVMTSIVYVISSKGKNLNQWHYFIGVVFTALLYAFSQYNTLFDYIDFNFIFILRILLLSGLSGMLYGWLYSTFHFESAALSHMLTNLFIILGNIIIVEMSAI